MLGKEEMGGVCVYPATDEIAHNADLHQYDCRPTAVRLKAKQNQLVRRAL